MTASRVGGIERLPVGVIDGHIEEGQQRRQHGLQRFVQGEELARHLLADLAVGLAIVDLEVGLEEVDDGQVAGRLAVGHGACFQDQPVLDPVGAGELVHEAGLPHAGFPHDGDELAVALVREGQRAADLLDLGVSADKSRQSTGGGRVKPGAHGPGSHEFADLHRLGPALHGQGAEGLDLDVAFSQLQRGRAEENAARLRKLLHPGREVRRLADRRVVHVQIGPDGAHHDLPGVEPDADLDHGRVSASHLVRVLLHALLHPERRVARAYGVILVGERRAEQRHDPVPHHLIHRALVAVDGLHHSLEDGVEDLPRLLGITIGE